MGLGRGLGLAAGLSGLIVGCSRPEYWLRRRTRVALVIGNGAYTSTCPKLPNPPKDAMDTAAALETAGVRRDAGDSTRTVRTPCSTRSGAFQEPDRERGHRAGVLCGARD